MVTRHFVASFTVLQKHKSLHHSGNMAACKQICESGIAAMEKCYENYILVDIGANLTHKKFSKDLESVIRRAKDSGHMTGSENGIPVLFNLITSLARKFFQMFYMKSPEAMPGVQKIMVTGTSLHNTKEALRLARIYPACLYSTAGIHPHEAKSWTDTTLEDLKSLASNSECVAVGECGLDYNRHFSPPVTQREVFEQQVKLACELKKPLFLHEREAHEDLVNILNKYKLELPMTVIHCFTGTVEEAKQYLDMGFYIGLTGYICKEKSDYGVRKLLEENVIPLDRLLVETDAPYMFPNSQASKLPVHVKQSLTERSAAYLNRYCTFQRNEPCSLPAIVEMIAAFMKKSPEEVALSTAFNALKIFGLSQ